MNNITSTLQNIGEQVIQAAQTFPTNFQTPDLTQWFLQHPIILLITVVIALFLVYEIYSLIVGSIFNIIFFILTLPFKILKFLIFGIFAIFGFIFRKLTGRSSSPPAKKANVSRSVVVGETVMTPRTDDVVVSQPDIYATSNVSVTPTPEEPTLLKRLNEIHSQQKKLQEEQSSILQQLQSKN